MAVDSFQKRMSAKYVLDPTAFGVAVTDADAGVDKAERQSAGRTYEGIPTSLPIAGKKSGFLLGVY